jgi:hypothetical protein
VLCGRAQPARGQQAIVTLPSADITDKGTVFAMKESQLRAWGEQPMWNATFFLTYGLGYHTELAATFFNIGVPATNEASVALGPKSALPILHDKLPWLDLKLTAGLMGLVSLEAKGLGYWVYTHLSFRLPKLATRLTAGISHGSKVLFLKDNATSFIAAVEQPVPWLHGLTLTAEWFSGSHDLSNFIVGAAYHPDPRLIFVLGYKIPTKDRHFTTEEQALVFEIGAFFK